MHPIKAENLISETFEIRTVLKLGNISYPMSFNIALEKMIREMQKSTGIAIEERTIQVLGVANNLNI